MGSEPLSEIKDFIWTRGFQDLSGAPNRTEELKTLADKRAQISEFRQFKKMFTLLVSEKSNSQNRHIYNFHASKNPDTNVRGISSLESGERVPHMFRTVPIGTGFHAN